MDAVEPFDSAFWSEMDEMDCPCKGSGWADINGTTKSCPVHYVGQLHPESQALLLDEPEKLKEEERKSNLNWKINKSNTRIKELQELLKVEQKSVVMLQLELINRTPTVKVDIASLPLEKSKKGKR